MLGMSNDDLRFEIYSELSMNGFDNDEKMQTLARVIAEVMNQNNQKIELQLRQAGLIR